MILSRYTAEEVKRLLDCYITAKEAGPDALQTFYAQHGRALERIMRRLKARHVNLRRRYRDTPYEDFGNPEFPSVRMLQFYKWLAGEVFAKRTVEAR